MLEGEPWTFFAYPIIRIRQSGACIIVSNCKDSGNEGINIELHKLQNRGKWLYSERFEVGSKYIYVVVRLNTSWS
jgi:hypothetical protein